MIHRNVNIRNQDKSEKQRKKWFYVEKKSSSHKFVYKSCKVKKLLFF